MGNDMKSKYSAYKSGGGQTPEERIAEAERLNNEGNYEEAFKIFKSEVEQGNREGLLSLAFAYEVGMGTEQDTAKAIETFLVAAEMGNPLAQFRAAELIYDGNADNKEKAIVWYSKAYGKVLGMAMEGDDYSQFMVGRYNEVNGDKEKAVEWYQKSAAQGCDDAQEALDALSGKSSRSSSGPGAEFYDQAESFRYGYEGKEDIYKAFEYYLKAAEMGHAEAQYELAELYNEGEGVEEDKDKALQWYHKSAALGNADAQHQLGFCYFFGEGVEEDEAVGTEWYRKAAEQGHTQAQYCYAESLYEGSGVPQNQNEAREWFRKAIPGTRKLAEKGYDSWQCNLGVCYEMIGEYDNAIEWYRKAADQGHETAQKKLNELRGKGYGNSARSYNSSPSNSSSSNDNASDDKKIKIISAVIGGVVLSFIPVIGTIGGAIAGWFLGPTIYKKIRGEK